jgi:hypothetical protein
MTITFSEAKLLLGRHRVFLGMGQMLLGTPELFLEVFLLLGKTHRFSGTLKQCLGIFTCLDLGETSTSSAVMVSPTWPGAGLGLNGR